MVFSFFSGFQSKGKETSAQCGVDAFNKKCTRTGFKQTLRTKIVNSRGMGANEMSVQSTIFKEHASGLLYTVWIDVKVCCFSFSNLRIQFVSKHRINCDHLKLLPFEIKIYTYDKTSDDTLPADFVEKFQGFKMASTG